MRQKSQRFWAFSSVGASAAVLAVGNAPIAVFTFAVFAGPLIAEFGWSRGELASALTAFTLLVGMSSPLFGILLDRFGVRWPSLISAVLGLAAFGCLSTVNQLAGFLLVFSVFGLASGGLTPIPYAKLVAQWFAKRRGGALALAMTGTGIGTALMPLYARYLIENLGWRVAYLAIAGTALVIACLALLLFVREKPEAKVTTLEAADTRPPLPSWSEVVLSRLFWVLAGATFLACIGVAGALAQCVPMLTDRGVSDAIAVSVLAVAGLASGLGRLISGVVMDHIFAPLVACSAFLIAGIGLFLLAGDNPAPVALYFLAAVLIGLSLGAEVDIMGYLVSRYFEIRMFGRVYGMLFFAFCLANGLGAYLLGLCFDIFGTYSPALIIGGALALIGGLLILRLGPYRYPCGAPDHSGVPFPVKVPV
ncbi:MFS transporter [Massilia sp. IC2-477]|uniref:MFS transporter n=1 Tax=Massilia sp. IC2-477 TaxID=2887198 RepID=UPI001D1090A5|nr:MFS transporter [Massilia sp. IC2-477]MCC2954353.1 MFS transporter [Massilia sp. IC2-477]